MLPLTRSLSLTSAASFLRIPQDLSEKCIDLFKRIKEVSQLTGYCEINEHYKGMADDTDADDVFQGTPWGTFSALKNEEIENLWSKLNPICDKTFKKMSISVRKNFALEASGRTSDQFQVLSMATSKTNRH